jgi:hypothetical protein
MNRSPKLRLLVPVAAIALFALALVAPAANAAYVPPLATTTQYKALSQFVEKLERLSNTPATNVRKASYDDQLSNKHDAAADKATALFNRGKKIAQAESRRAVKTGVRTIRDTEATELAALRKDYDARLNQVTANYEGTVGRLEDVYDNKVASLRKQIRRLRNQKANAEGVIRKAQIQDAIDRRSQRITADRKIEQEELADLRAGYRREKAAVSSAKGSASRSVQQNDQEAMETLRTRAKQIYGTRVRTLQSRRVDQLHDLERKLEAGRDAIARMPTVG